MADVTGPISSLPGSMHSVPKGIMCDDCAAKPATVRIQGETDSMGAEMHDLCEECARKTRAEMRSETFVGTCEWCKAEDVLRVPARDYEEGLSGRVYYVCQGCKDRQSARLTKEAEDWGAWGDDD